jgi:hypothetical protein
MHILIGLAAGVALLAGACSVLVGAGFLLIGITLAFEWIGRSLERIASAIDLLLQQVLPTYVRRLKRILPR